MGFPLKSGLSKGFQTMSTELVLTWYHLRSSGAAEGLASRVHDS